MMGALAPKPAPVAVTVELPGAAGPHETESVSEGAASAGCGTCANSIAAHSIAVVAIRRRRDAAARPRRWLLPTVRSEAAISQPVRPTSLVPLPAKRPSLRRLVRTD